MDESLNWRDPFFSLLLPGILLVCSGIISNQVQGASREVNGIVGGSVLLSIMIPKVVEMRWKFGNTKIRLGDSKGKRFEPYNLSDPSFTLRLQMENESTLRITSLMKNDSGIFKAEVQLQNGSTVDVEFHLKVYDPVPVPRIVYEGPDETSGWCNVTLDCQIPNESNVNFSWAIPTSDGNKSTKYEKLSEGRELPLSLRTDVPTDVDSEYFCLISNPVDQKNTSISPLCSKGSLSSRRTGYFFIPLGLILLPILGLLIYLMAKKRKKRKSEVGHRELSAEADHEEVQMFTPYACVARSHPDGNDEVQCDSEYSSPKMEAKRPKMTTIYDVLQPPQDSTLAEIC